MGIATRYELEGPWIESQWGVRLSAPCLTCPEAQPASYTVGIRSFPEVKRLDGGVNHPHYLGPTLKEGYSNTSTPLCVVMAGYRVNFTLPQQQACKKTFVLGETGTQIRDGVSNNYSIRYSSVVTGYLVVENRHSTREPFPVAAWSRAWV